MYELMRKLIKTPSPSGFERKMGEVLKEIVSPLVDEVYFDNMGNLIAYKKGSAQNAKKLMFAAHMDEIGFIITNIDDKGYLRCAPLGGINWTAAAYTTVLFANGVKGILVPEGQVAAGDWKNDKMYIDIGALNKKDAEKKISVGDVAIYDPKIERLMHHRIAGHPFDDKIGCAVMIKALQKAQKIENDTYFVFTVQEEVGCRGSKTSAFGIMPDWAIAFDVTGTGDTIGCRPMAVSLGDGAAIKIKDSSVICDGAVVELLKKLSAENKIKNQLEILEYGGTDTSSMQMAGAGTLAGCISVPTRYIHSGVEMVDLDDVNACVDLAAVLLSYDLGKTNL